MVGPDPSGRKRPLPTSFLEDEHDARPTKKQAHKTESITEERKVQLINLALRHFTAQIKHAREELAQSGERIRQGQDNRDIAERRVASIADSTRNETSIHDQLKTELSQHPGAKDSTVEYLRAVRAVIKQETKVSDLRSQLSQAQLDKARACGVIGRHQARRRRLFAQIEKFQDAIKSEKKHLQAPGSPPLIAASATAPGLAVPREMILAPTTDKNGAPTQWAAIERSQAAGPFPQPSPRSTRALFLTESDAHLVHGSSSALATPPRSQPRPSAPTADMDRSHSNKALESEATPNTPSSTEPANPRVAETPRSDTRHCATDNDSSPTQGCLISDSVSSDDEESFQGEDTCEH